VALVLNLVVSVQGSIQFCQAGHLRWRLFWPLFAGLPAAFVGGWLHLPSQWLGRLLAVVLVASAVRFLQQPHDSRQRHEPLPLQLLGSGLVLGFLAGLTGTGGGVLLTPLLLLRGWASTRQAAAVSSLFIFGNSLFGLLGWLMSRQGTSVVWPAAIGWMVASVLVAGALGSRMGSHHWPTAWMRRILVLVLLLAAGKLLDLGG